MQQVLRQNYVKLILYTSHIYPHDFDGLRQDYMYLFLTIFMIPLYRWGCDDVFGRFGFALMLVGTGAVGLMVTVLVCLASKAWPHCSKKWVGIYAQVLPTFSEFSERNKTLPFRTSTFHICVMWMLAGLKILKPFVHVSIYKYSNMWMMSVRNSD